MYRYVQKSVVSAISMCNTGIIIFFHPFNFHHQALAGPEQGFSLVVSWLESLESSSGSSIVYPDEGGTVIENV